MNGLFSGDWAAIKQRYEAWWRGENTDGPILGILAPKTSGQATPDSWAASSSGETAPTKAASAQSTSTQAAPAPAQSAASPESFWTDKQAVLRRHLAMFDGAHITADGYPRIFANLGAVSLAPLLGAHPSFAQDTIWYEPILTDLASADVQLDVDNRWLQWSLDSTRYFHEHEQARYVTGIPDLSEHMDVLACLMESQQLLLELFDNPDQVHRLLAQIQRAWFAVYQMHHDIVKHADGFCCYGPFALLGRGRIAKLQCDMSAMFSKDMFDEFVLPYLVEQANWLDHSLYHLDGVDALKHLDSVLSIPSLDALQWTPGAGKPDGGDAEWDPLYDKARDAGKRIYALVHPANIARFIKRYGGNGVTIITGANDSNGAEGIVTLVQNCVRRA